MLIGIIGNGIVGKATQLLSCEGVNICVYDSVPGLCIPKDLNFFDLLSCDIIFICLPTPMNMDGSCYTDPITDTINKLKRINYHNIVIRSTVPINYCNDNNVFCMSDFLTEKNWKDDFINNRTWLCGLGSNNEANSTFQNTITTLIDLSYKHGKIKSNDVIFLKNNELELIKLIKNTFLACKVGYFNEMYDLAKTMDIDYDKVINILSMDERIGKTHMKVPGHDNMYGYGGTCFPKDMNSLYNILNKNNIKSYFIKSSLERNEYYDRSEKDWLQNLNKTVIDNRKNIILVLGLKEKCHKLSSKLIENSDNFIICSFDFEHLSSCDNFLYSHVKTNKPMFFPKIDCIYYLLDNLSKPTKRIISELYNVLKLSKVHKTKTFLEIPSNVFSSIVKEYNNKHALDLDITYI